MKLHTNEKHTTENRMNQERSFSWIKQPFRKVTLLLVLEHPISKASLAFVVGLNLILDFGHQPQRREKCLKLATGLVAASSDDKMILTK